MTIATKRRGLAAVALMVLLAVVVSLAAVVPAHAANAATADTGGAGSERPVKKLILDEAGLLDADEASLLNLIANRLSADRETDFIIYTTLNPDGTDVMKLTQDFYDERAPGFDKAHGNAAILTVDMNNREVYLAGFYKGETYLDDGRLDRIREKITPDMTSGYYYTAFNDFLETAHRYMGYEPGVDPDNIFFKLWFQMGLALAIGGIVVWTMARNSGGRVTVHRHTYEDAGTSGVLEHRDQYLRTTVTKQKIERSSGGGGGGGTTGGGHSHSGSRGSF